MAMVRKPVGLVGCALMLLGWLTSVAPAQQIFWADLNQNTIKRANGDGTAAQVIARSANPTGITYDAPTNRLYWLGSDGVHIASPDGSGHVHFSHINLAAPRGIAVDSAGVATGGVGKIYFSEEGPDTIKRVNLDGSGVEVVLGGLSTPRQIDLDLPNRHVYWASSGADGIRRANLDGTGLTDLVGGLSLARGFALDLPRGKMYWSDGAPDVIQRANLDGSSVETILSGGFSRLHGVAVDSVHQTLYYMDSNTDVIGRANLDGTNREVISRDVSRPWGITVAPNLPDTLAPLQFLALAEQTGEIFRIDNQSPITRERVATLPMGANTDLSGLVRAGPDHALVFERFENLIYRVNIRTGELESTVALDQDAWVSRRGFARHPDGTLYGVLPAMELRTVNETDGSSQFITHITGAPRIEAIAFDPTGTLYAVGSEDNNFTSEILFNLNPETGELTRIGHIGFRDMDALTFAPDGFLYAADAFSGPADLIRIDPATGEGIAVGNSGIRHLNGIVFIPEPATGAVLTCALIALTGRRRPRRTIPFLSPCLRA